MPPQKKEGPIFHGSCACGRLTYTSTAPPSSTTSCFCSTCRKLSGSDSMTFTHIPASSITLYDSHTLQKLEGPPREDFAGLKLLRLSTFAERAGCVDCGTPLTMVLRARLEEVGVNVGSVDGEGLGAEVREGFRAEKAIFVGSAPGWVDVGRLGVRMCEGFDGGVEEEGGGGLEGGR